MNSFTEYKYLNFQAPNIATHGTRTPSHPAFGLRSNVCSQNFYTEVEIIFRWRFEALNGQPVFGFFLFFRI